MNASIEKLFNLDGNLNILKVVPAPFSGFYVVLKKISFKMYPIKSFGKKETTYLIYRIDSELQNADYVLRLTNLKDVKTILKSLQKVVD
jgi:hypothetical protein